MGLLSFRIRDWSCSLGSVTGIVRVRNSITNSSFFFGTLHLSDRQERRKCSGAYVDAIVFLCVGSSIISFIQTRNIVISCNSVSWWKSDKLVIVLQVHECVQDLTRIDYPLFYWIHGSTKQKACGCADSQSPHVGACYPVVLRDLTMRSFYIRRATYILLNIHALVDCYLCAGHDLQLQRPGSCLYPPWWKSKSPWCCWYPFQTLYVWRITTGSMHHNTYGDNDAGASG